MKASSSTLGLFFCISIGISILFTSGCSHEQSEGTQAAVTEQKTTELTATPPKAIEPKITQCTDPRPEMCTREYMPVCATKDTGVRCVTTPCPSTEEVTYPTGCTACSDAAVIGYRQGQCELVFDAK